MDIESQFDRRSMMKWGLLSAAGAPLLLGKTALAQQGLGPSDEVLGRVDGRDEARLFTGHTPRSGGQMEIRLNQSIHTDDPDELEVANRLRPFDPLSWYNEWLRVAQINAELAQSFEEDNLRLSANQYYLRAFRFYRAAIIYQEDTDETMMPGYMKMMDMFNKAWEMVRPPFERVKVMVDGNELDGYFRKPGGPPGTRYPTVINYLGADSMAESTVLGRGSLVARGLAVLVVDLPGQGAAKRLKHLYMQPDTERYVSDLVDYLETRPDVDPNRIAMMGQSMGGYAAPRAAASEPRIKAVSVTAGSHDLERDLFDYFPPIQERIRWIIGARDLADTKRKIRDYTNENVARRIECPMLIGYGPTDRIMDPEGAYRLYQAAVNSDRTMWAGGGHPHHTAKSGGPIDRRLPTEPDWLARTLGTI
jgi:alpha-beta hydrolase superfamily lysophospholipase